MANYNLVVNSLYNPLSYLELLAPLKELNLALLAAELLYLEMMTKTGLLELYAKEEPGGEADTRYTAYMNSLRNASDLLNTSGITAGDRKKLYNFVADYARLMLPIEAAAELRNKERILRALRKGTTFEKDAKVSINQLLADPNYTSNYVNRDAVTKTAASMASALAKEFRGFAKTKSPVPIMEGVVLKYGINPQDAAAFLNGDSQAEANILNTIYNNVLKSYGIDESWVDFDLASDAVKSAIFSGAIGEDKASLVENPVAKANLEVSTAYSKAYNSALGLLKALKDWDKLNPDTITTSPFDLVNVYLILHLENLKEFLKEGYLYKKDGVLLISYKYGQLAYKLANLRAKELGMTVKELSELATLDTATAESIISNMPIDSKKKTELKLTVLTEPGGFRITKGQSTVQNTLGARSALRFIAETNKLLKNPNITSLPNTVKDTERIHNLYADALLYPTSVNLETILRLPLSESSSNIAVSRLSSYKPETGNGKVVKYKLENGKMERDGDFNLNSLSKWGNNKGYTVIDLIYSPSDIFGKGNFIHIRSNDKNGEEFYIENPNLSLRDVSKKINWLMLNYTKMWGNKYDLRAVNALALQDLYYEMLNSVNTFDLQLEKLGGIGILILTLNLPSMTELTNKNYGYRR